MEFLRTGFGKRSLSLGEKNEQCGEEVKNKGLHKSDVLSMCTAYCGCCSM